jgi:hypothetical protein
MQRILVPLTFLAWVLGGSPVVHGVHADEPHRAGILVLFADGRVESRCVAFTGPEITGLELLELSGLNFVMDASSGLGVTVCQIEGQGCSYPAEPCFCRCMGGGSCAYWNYFYQEPGASDWSYSALGAVLRRVRPGGIEAWVWGDGRALPERLPAFETICTSPTAQPTPTVAPPPTRVAASTAIPAATRTPALARSTPVPATATALAPTSLPTAHAAGEPGLATYGSFGLMLLTLLMVAVIVGLRRR